MELSKIGYFFELNYEIVKYHYDLTPEKYDICISVVFVNGVDTVRNPKNGKGIIVEISLPYLFVSENRYLQDNTNLISVTGMSVLPSTVGLSVS